MAPLHVILVSVGTDGDVYPFIGLGDRLRADGHRVTLLVQEQFRALAAERGFAFHPWVSEAEHQALLTHPDFWHPLRSARVAAAWGARFVPRQYELLAGLARGSDTVIAANPGILAARLVQEKLGRPMATVMLQPGLIPSVAAPPILPGGLTLPTGLPAAVGWLYWRLIDAAGDVLVSRALDPLRAELGLPPMRRIFRWWYSPERIVGLFPDWYGPPQPDWPPQIRLAGFPRGDARPMPGLPADVEAFLGAGPPPVAITFGTGMMHGARLFRIAMAACRRLGLRGLLLTRYAHQLGALPPDMRHCAYAPFGQLLPRCAALVHHGGVGTVARALATGTPQLIVPLAFDQRDNAARVSRLGVGTWLDPRQRTAGHAARALAGLLNPAVRARCQAVAARFGATDALAIAAGWIVELARR